MEDAKTPAEQPKPPVVCCELVHVGEVVLRLGSCWAIDYIRIALHDNWVSVGWMRRHKSPVRGTS